MRSSILFLALTAIVLVFTCPPVENHVVTETETVRLHIHVHGINGGILSDAINVVLKVIRDGIKIVGTLAPHVSKALNDILDDLVGAVNGVTIDTGHALVILVQTLIKLVKDAIEAVAGLLEDAAVVADAVVHGAVSLVLTGLHVFLGALRLFLPAVKLVAGVIL